MKHTWNSDHTPPEWWLAKNFGFKHSLVCGFCGWVRPQDIDNCPRCARWNPDVEDDMSALLWRNDDGSPPEGINTAHMIRTMLKSALGYLPGITTWRR